MQTEDNIAKEICFSGGTSLPVNNNWQSRASVETKSDRKWYILQSIKLTKFVQPTIKAEKGQWNTNISVKITKC